MSVARQLHRGACLAAIALSAIAAPAALADEPVETARVPPPSPPPPPPPTITNPNAAEWSLINLTPTTVASASGGLGVKVAVLDGLAYCQHSELVGRCNYNLMPGGTYTSYDTHGTHTASTVAGKNFGVATSATVINYAVFDQNGWAASGTKLADTWKSAYAAGARISSMSFGCTKTALCFSAAEVATMADPTRPMLYVKAAGNDGANLLNEAIGVSGATAAVALNRTLLVGSVNVTGTISSFSNRPGEACFLPTGATTCPEAMKWKNHFLVAPGEQIYAAFPGSGYVYMSGTSMATPIVAGAAALLQQRWPALKSAPETLASILLTTATDKGAPGVDPVYGYGLLNVAAAFAANGTITLKGSGGSSTVVSETTTTTSPMLRNLGAALQDVTVYDRFGRDFTVGETTALQVSRNVMAMRQFLGRRLLASSGHDEWTAGFFAEEAQARGFAMFGSAAEAPGSVMALDRSTRMGIDMPFKGGVAQFRLTGIGDARQDFAYDTTMRPLAYFASTGLLRGALIGNALIKLPGRGRLMVYGVATTGAMNPRFDGNPLDMRLTEQGYLPLAAFSREDSVRSQTGFGVGFWTQAGERTVLGVNASAMMQQGGYYSLTSNLADFQRPTKLFNLGAAAIRKLGDWEVSLSGEMTHLRTSGGALLAFTPATLVSGELGLRKANLAFAHGTVRDSLALSFTVPPRAIAGSLQVNYLTPTADGLGRESAMLSVPISALGSEPMRIEAAYRLGAGDRWSFNLSGGVNLEQVPGLGAGEGMATFKFTF